MKIKEIKHNHSLTDLLKVLIFSILMITPLLSVATRCLYVICNKNAYQSYYGETINEVEYTNVLPSKMSVGKPYLIDFVSQTSDTTIRFYINVKNVKATYNQTEYNYEEGRIEIFDSNNNLICRLKDVANTTTYFSTTSPCTIEYDYFSWVQDINADNYNRVYEITYNDYSYMDNVFEYSVNKLAESPILSWTQQTAIYTGVNTMTTQLGVSTPTIPMLIVYWFMLTIIYIIIDILLVLFTKLTHMIGNKTS